MHVDAVITDLDGTFWSPSSEIHPNSMDTVARLDEHGIPFVIATGRRARGAHHGLAPYGLGSRPAILMNGAVVREALDGPSIWATAIDSDAALGVLELFRAGGLEPVVYVDHPENDMLIGEGSAAGEAYLSKTVGYERVDNVEDAMANSIVIGFGAFGFPHELLSPISNAVNEAELAAAVIGVSLIEGGHGIMVQPHGVHKQVGIEKWCAYADVDLSRLAVIGDGHNDIEMLEAAKIAIVPSNAPPEIVEFADAIIPPNEEGGWEEIPALLGLG